MNDLNAARWLSVHICLQQMMRNLGAFDAWRQRHDDDGMQPKVVAAPVPDTAINREGWTAATDHAAPSKLTKINYAAASSASTSVLLHADIGIWDDNQGRLCMFYDFHFAYAVTVKYFQTDHQPIQPFIMPWLRKMMQKVERYGDAEAAGGPGGEMFLLFKDGLRKTHAAQTTRADADELIDRLDEECVEFAAGFELFYEYHFEPYTPALMALELANPYVAKSTLQDGRTWEGLGQLCYAFGMVFGTTRLQLDSLRDHFTERRCPAEELACKEHWLGYMDADVVRDPRWWHEHPLAMLFIVKVSALATFSYKAEQKFSEMDYMVGDRKARTKMDVFENAMFIKSTKRFGADVNRDNDGVGAGNFQPSFL